jgi:prepilin peptidase CpaA
MLERDLLWIGVVVFTGAAAIQDYRSGRIPNRLVWVGLPLGACQQLAAILGRLGPEQLLSVGLVNVIAGVAVCAAVPFLLFELGWLGGGDVKLLGAVGAFLGPTLGLELSFVAFIVAALYLPGRLLYAGELSRRVSSWARRRVSGSLRFGPGAAPEATEPLKLAFAPCVFVAAAIVALTHWSPA